MNASTADKAVAAGGASRLRSYRLVRQLHLWLGAWGAIAAVIYGFTGLVMNHRFGDAAWPQGGNEEIARDSLSVPVAARATPEALSLWLRAAHGHPEGRRAALTYAAGITAVQVFWLARLGLDGQAVLLGTFVLGMAIEFAVPYLAERHHRTPYHPEHIAERYGLFTIIVLGEVVLSSVMAVQGALEGDEYVADLIPLVVGGMLLVFSLWWLYFKRDTSPLFASEKTVFPTAYAHAFGDRKSVV